MSELTNGRLVLQQLLTVDQYWLQQTNGRAVWFVGDTYSLRSQTLEASSLSAVQPLELDLSEQLNKVARALVFNKYMLDKAMSEHGASMLAGDLHGGIYGPHEPMSFLGMVLPFLKFNYSVNDTGNAMVPISHTLGCSWRWRRRHLSPKEAEQIERSLSDPEALLKGTHDTARYIWIKSLGIFAPSEGKNRVDFFREINITSIPAKVSEWSYPSADRIKLYKVEDRPFNGTWAVLDDRWVQKVQYPSWTYPLLIAYGVEVVENWPRHFPSFKFISADPSALQDQLGFRNDKIPDLEKMKAREAYQSEYLRCSMLELKNIRIDIRIWCLAITTIFICFLGLRTSPDEWESFRSAAGILLGASLSVALFPILPIMIARRRAVLEPFNRTRDSAENYNRASNPEGKLHE